MLEKIERAESRSFSYFYSHNQDGSVMVFVASNKEGSERHTILENLCLAVYLATGRPVHGIASAGKSKLSGDFDFLYVEDFSCDVDDEKRLKQLYERSFQKPAEQTLDPWVRE